ncbi:MAG: hypothetical protein QOD99_1107 [Chthoniobacter sp.]|jgi:hypothetical protein|nr:hypothetical protein [Chthoniobacter sp.]
MRSKLLFLTLLALAFLALYPAGATDLRGRVDGFNPYTNTMGPFPGVRVGLFTPLPDGSFAIVRESVSGPDGMYYLKGVYPGQYVLQIGGVNYPLGVGLTLMQDIPPIRR